MASAVLGTWIRTRKHALLQFSKAWCFRIQKSCSLGISCNSDRGSIASAIFQSWKCTSPCVNVVLLRHRGPKVTGAGRILLIDFRYNEAQPCITTTGPLLFAYCQSALILAPTLSLLLINGLLASTVFTIFSMMSLSIVLFPTLPLAESLITSIRTVLFFVHHLFLISDESLFGVYSPVCFSHSKTSLLSVSLTSLFSPVKFWLEFSAFRWVTFTAGLLRKFPSLISLC